MQPSLVYGPGGGSARLFNQLAALPMTAMPLRGAMQVQPVHRDDVVAGVLALLDAPARAQGTIAFVGPQPMALRNYLRQLRAALGIAGTLHVLPLPVWMFRAAASVAGHVPGSSLDSETAAMLLRGNVAPADDFRRLLGREPLPVNRFVAPSQAHALRTQAVLDAWVPALRISLALLWLWTGIVSLGLYPVADSLALLARVGLHGTMAKAALYGAALLDLALGVLTLAAPARLRRAVWAAQLLLIWRVHGADHRLPARVLAAPVRADLQEPAAAGRHRPAVDAGARAGQGRLMDYVTVKWLHILSSTLLFGTGIGSAFYLLIATWSREARAVAAVSRYVVVADWLFTATTAVFQPASGFWLMHLAGGMPVSTPWIAWSLRLYAFAHPVLAAGRVDPVPAARPVGAGGGKGPRAAAGVLALLRLVGGVGRLGVHDFPADLLPDDGQAAAVGGLNVDAARRARGDARLPDRGGRRRGLDDGRVPGTLPAQGAGDRRGHEPPAMIPKTRNVIGFPEGIAGEELLLRLREHAQRYKTPLEMGRVERLSRRPTAASRRKRAHARCARVTSCSRPAQGTWRRTSRGWAFRSRAAWCAIARCATATRPRASASPCSARASTGCARRSSSRTSATG